MSAEPEKPSKKSDERSTEASGAKRTASGSEPPTELVSFTLDVRSGRLVKVEAVAPGGERRALSAEEAARLATKRGSTLEDVLERTFEAGISSVLEGASVEEVEPESEDEARLRRMILRPMMARSAAGRLMKPEVLGRAILATLIHDALGAQAPPSRSAAASASASKAAGGPRRQQPRGKPH